MTITLVVGSKNYSSWSMRAGVATALSGLPYEEIVIPLDRPDTAERIREHSRAGLVPIVKDGTITVWESLSIMEYLAERAPDKTLWPAEAEARAVARSIAAEMHAGFQDLRRELPMNARKRYRHFAIGEAALRNIARVTEIWRDCRNRYGRPAGGDFLFGGFGLADAMYAPVVSRLVTYGATLDATTGAYVEAVLAHDAVAGWMRAGEREPEIAKYEFADARP